jgi:acyl-CoA dehydrogenase
VQRTIFDDDHDAFRQTIRQFFEKEVVPEYPAWEKQGHPPKDFYRRMGELGFLGLQVPEEYGGAGVESYKFNAIINEESVRAGLTLGPLRVHLDLVLPYLLGYANEEQRRRWLPGFVAGEMMTAIAMTEPGTGSDLPGSGRRPGWTVTTTSSTARRRSSPAASTPIAYWSSAARPHRAWTTAVPA